MLVRTGANDRAVIAVSDPGGDIRVALSSDTLVEAPTSHHELTARKGAVYVVRPEVGEPASAKPFVFRLPAISATLAAPSQRFEFVLYHDDATDADAVLVNDGALDIEAGGRHLSLKAGQLPLVAHSRYACRLADVGEELESGHRIGRRHDSV